jgi:1,2-diacylglycerol 3-beta-galactosyltransferase
MILDPRFYSPRQIDRAAERERLGLRPDLPTGLVLFGGEGSLEMVRIARCLSDAVKGIQLILLCGRNQEALRQLGAFDSRIPLFVEGFTRDVPYYMALADFFIGKPGPGSISEAIAMGLPLIVERNAWTLAHERYNADWIEEQELGLVVRSFSRIAEAVTSLLDPHRYRRCRERLSNMRNCAVYEIPVALEKILSGSDGPAELPPPPAQAYAPVVT